MPPKRQKTDQQTPEDQNKFSNAETVVFSPVMAANEAANTAIESLALSLGQSLAFLKNVVKQIFILHDIMKKKNEAITTLQKPESIPRSIRFGFKLTFPPEVQAEPEFAALVDDYD